MKRIVLLLLLGSFACANSPVLVPDAAGRPIVGATSVNCKKPVELPRDCSSISGPKRLIEVSGVRMRIAGSADGRTILLAGPNPNSDSLAGAHAQITNSAYEVVKRELVRRGIRMTRVDPIASMGSLFGYLVYYDGDAYTALETFALPD